MWGVLADFPTSVGQRLALATVGESSPSVPQGCGGRSLNVGLPRVPPEQVETIPAFQCSDSPDLDPRPSQLRNRRFGLGRTRNAIPLRVANFDAVPKQRDQIGIANMAASFPALPAPEEL